MNMGHGCRWGAGDGGDWAERIWSLTCPQEAEREELPETDTEDDHRCFCICCDAHSSKTPEKAAPPQKKVLPSQFQVQHGNT